MEDSEVKAKITKANKEKTKESWKPHYRAKQGDAVLLGM